MPKFDLGINGKDQGAAEGREAWSGELPPTGSYEGVLQVVSTDVITGEDSEYKGEAKLRIGVQLRNTPGKKFDGYLAWGNLNLIDPSIPFVNQFLIALTDGSDEQFTKIKAAFYDGGIRVDDREKHITDIGAWKINSPKGELPIKVALKNSNWTNPKTQQTNARVTIESYLLNENAPKRSGGSASAVASIAEEQPVTVELEDEGYDDGSILDAEDEGANA